MYYAFVWCLRDSSVVKYRVAYKVFHIYLQKPDEMFNGNLSIIKSVLCIVVDLRVTRIES